MGMSASGMIFYGVAFGEEDPRYMGDDESEDDGLEWDEWLAVQARWESPWDDPVVETIPRKRYDRNLNWSDQEALYQKERKEWDNEHADWMERRQQFDDAKAQLEAASPVTLVMFGHHECSQYGLALKGTQCEAWGWDVKEIPMHLFGLVTPTRVIDAARWCQEHGLTFENPAWLLTATYG